MNSIFEISSTANYRDIVVVDNFYKNPDIVRSFALQQKFFENNNYYKGIRSKEKYLTDSMKHHFENLIGESITDSWHTHQFNGCFQVTSAENLQVFHCDENSWAGVLYLTPDPPLQSGTKILRSKNTNLIDMKGVSESMSAQTFSSGFYDGTKFETVDNIGNVYNRLVLFKSTKLHCAGDYFGTSMWNGRLIHLFFFDTE